MKRLDERAKHQRTIEKKNLTTMDYVKMEGLRLGSVDYVVGQHIYTLSAWHEIYDILND